MNSRQALAVAGAVLLVVGVFAPLLSMPLGEPVTYYEHARGEAIAVLALAVLSFGLALAGQYAALWLTGAGSAGLLAYTYTHVEARITGVGRDGGGVFGDALRALSQVAMDSVRHEWGWAILAAGAVLLLAAAALRHGRA